MNSNSLFLTGLEADFLAEDLVSCESRLPGS